jgi:hypothetical protein
MSNVQLTDGSPVPADRSHTEIDPATGMQKGYVVLTAEERAKGFVKPVRRSYTHVGPPGAPPNLRDLTPEEHERYDQYGYAKFEPYGEDQSPVTGKFWTEAELKRAGKRCGSLTTMGTSLAETYARDPNFYSGTFCCACGQHFPLNEFKWEPDGEPMEPSLQEAWHANEGARKAKEQDERRQRRIAELERELSALRSEG